MVPESIYIYLPHGRQRGSLKAKLIEEKYEQNRNFLGGLGGGGGGGCILIKKLPWRDYGYFLELHIGFSVTDFQQFVTPCIQISLLFSYLYLLSLLMFTCVG